MRTAIQVMAEFCRVNMELIQLHALLSSTEVGGADHHAGDLMRDHNVVAHSMHQEHDERGYNLMESRHAQLRRDIERLKARAKTLIEEMESLDTVEV